MYYGGQRLVNFVTMWLQVSIGIGLFYVSTKIYLKESQVVKILKIYIIVITIAATFGVFQLLANALGYDIKLNFINLSASAQMSGYEHLTKSFVRSSSFFSEPRQFGAFLLVGIGLIVMLNLVGYKFFGRRYLSKVILFILVAGLLSTISTSGILMSLFVVLLSFYIVKRLSLSNFLGLSLFILVIIFLVSAIIYSINIEVLEDMKYALGEKFSGPSISTFSMSNEKSGWGEYIRSIYGALNLFVTHPIVGVGLNNMENYQTSFSNYAFPLFRIFAEIGIIGMMAIIYVFILLRKKILIVERRNSFLSHSGRIIIYSTIIVMTVSGYFSISSVNLWFNLSLLCLIINSRGIDKEDTSLTLIS